MLTMRPLAKDPARRAMPVAEWPELHSAFWKQLTTPAGILDDAGAGAKWRDASRMKIQRAWGRFLTWHSRRGLSPLDEVQIGELATPALISDFIESLREKGLKTISIAGIISNIETLVKHWRPSHDWGWLAQLRRRLWARSVKRKDVTARIVLSDQAFPAALAYMESACKRPPHLALDHHSRFRDGLMMAILISRCLRLTNLTNIEICRNLLRMADGWTLAFAGFEMKNGSPVNIPLPAVLNPYIDEYLSVHRPKLLNRGNTPALWVSNLGLAMPEASVVKRVRVMSKRLFGKEINPHAFRHSGATSVEVHDPEGIHTVPVLLQHLSPLVGQAHYQQAGTIIAGRRHADSLKTLRRSRPRIGE